MISELRLYQFRCYSQMAWEVPERGALILGDNAQGKTTLLEALCFALRLHSPRTAQAAKMLRHGAPQFGLRLTVQDIVRRIVWNGGKLDLRVNDEQRADYAAYLSDSAPVVWFGNQDMELIMGASEQRRAHLDFLGTQWHPGYRNELLRYRKALKSRNHLLKYGNRNPASIRSYTKLLVEHGERLVSLRAQLLRLLLPHIVQSHERIAGRAEPVELHYIRSTEEPLADMLERSLDDDLRCGHTRYGPHRDDFRLCINGMPAADYASEGQRRTLAAALKFAQASLLCEETGIAPYLLIDDIFGELDPSRRQCLMEMIPRDSQVFITTTHDSWAQDNAALPKFTLSGGKLHPAS